TIGDFMVVPLVAGNLQHPSSKFASRYGHLKTIPERCKNHTRRLLCAIIHIAPRRRNCHYSRVSALGGCARSWLPPWRLLRAGILEDGVVTFWWHRRSLPTPTCQNLAAASEQTRLRCIHGIRRGSVGALGCVVCPPISLDHLTQRSAQTLR